MTKLELAKKYGRSVSSVYRAMQKLYGRSAGLDLTDRMIEEIESYFEKLGGVKIHKVEDQNAIYHEVYDEIVSKGFILAKDLKHRLGVKILGNFLGDMDDLNLWTYDDSVVVKEITDKGNVVEKEYQCIRACDLGWNKK